MARGHELGEKSGNGASLPHLVDSNEILESLPLPNADGDDSNRNPAGIQQSVSRIYLRDAVYAVLRSVIGSII